MKPIFLVTGLPGSGKTTVSEMARELYLNQDNTSVEILDGDLYREGLSPDIGFSPEDRIENCRRLGFVATRLAANDVIPIIAAIAPSRKCREAIAKQASRLFVIHLDCDVKILQTERDYKGNYRRALLPPHDPAHLPNFTGVSAFYDPPERPDLTIDTGKISLKDSAEIIYEFICRKCGAL